MTKIPHIVFLRRLPAPPMWGGLEKIMMDWFEQIDYRACRVTLAVSAGGTKLFQERLAQKNLPVGIVEFDLEFKGDDWALFRTMNQFLRPLRPQSVIFIQGAFSDFQLGDVLAGFLLTRGNVRMSENLGVPSPLPKTSERYLGVFPGLGLWWHWQVRRANLRAFFSRNVLALSQEMAQGLVNGWNYPADRVMVAYHGIDLKRFTPNAGARQKIRAEFKIGKDDFVFTAAARLSEIKRLDRVINAFDLLAAAHQDIWLMLIGDGDQREELQQLARQKKCGRRIIFCGHQERVEDFFSAADCYVNSSDSEGLCLALLEAMSCGLVCVATRCQGPTELLHRGQVGFLTEKSMESVLEGMDSALALSAVARKQMVEKGKEFVKQHFDIGPLIQESLHKLSVPAVHRPGS